MIIIMIIIIIILLLLLLLIVIIKYLYGAQTTIYPRLFTLKKIILKDGKITYYHPWLNHREPSHHILQGKYKRLHLFFCFIVAMLNF